MFHNSQCNYTDDLIPPFKIPMLVAVKIAAAFVLLTTQENMFQPSLLQVTLSWHVVEVCKAGLLTKSGK